MTKSLFVKRFSLFLLLIYCCQLAQQHSVTAYFKEKVWATTAPVQQAAEMLSKCRYAGESRHPIAHFSFISCLEAFDSIRPRSFLNGKVKAFFCKNCPMWC